MGTVTAPNQVWVSDLTYLPLQASNWVYLLAWIDLFSRRFVGWWVEADMKESLLIRAFDQTTAQRRPAPGLLLHSDRVRQNVPPTPAGVAMTAEHGRGRTPTKTRTPSRSGAV